MSCKAKKTRMLPSNRDDWYMTQALKQAEVAAQRAEVPVGAIIIDAHGTIVARAYNQTIKRTSPFAHAEILAIQKASRKQKDWRLTHHTLYVTVEPCALCMHVILMSRIQRIVYGASSPQYGFSLDKYCTFEVYKTPLVIQAGIKKTEAQQYMKQFFRQKRSRSHEQKTNQDRACPRTRTSISAKK